MQAELTLLLSYDPYERSVFNINSQYFRLIDSEYGKLEIVVPRDLHNYLLPAYSRHQDVLETTVIKVLLLVKALIL